MKFITIVVAFVTFVLFVQPAQAGSGPRLEVCWAFGWTTDAGEKANAGECESRRDGSEGPYYSVSIIQDEPFAVLAEVNCGISADGWAHNCLTQLHVAKFVADWQQWMK